MSELAEIMNISSEMQRTTYIMTNGQEFDAAARDLHERPESRRAGARHELDPVFRVIVERFVLRFVDFFLVVSAHVCFHLTPCTVCIRCYIYYLCLERR
jgi:hypothetical protein